VDNSPFRGLGILPGNSQKKNRNQVESEKEKGSELPQDRASKRMESIQKRLRKLRTSLEKARYRPGHLKEKAGVRQETELEPRRKGPGKDKKPT